MHKLYYLPLCIAALTLSGCGNSGLSADEKEERVPLVKAGQGYVEEGRWKDAETAFKQSLDKDPQLARPHLELAQIYQQHLPDFAHAIYHYDRYLELRPDTEKREFIEQQREKVQRALEVQAIRNSAEVKQVVAEAQRLMQENAALKKQLAAAAKAPAPTTQPVAASNSTTSPVLSAASAQPSTAKTPTTHQIYTVVAGDTLTKIAKKFYNDPTRWDTIFEANKDSLASPSALHVGQSLIIPNLGN